MKWFDLFAEGNVSQLRTTVINEKFVAHPIATKFVVRPNNAAGMTRIKHGNKNICVVINEHDDLGDFILDFSFDGSWTACLKTQHVVRRVNGVFMRATIPYSVILQCEEENDVVRLFLSGHITHKDRAAEFLI